MTKSEWTQKALATLEREGLIQNSMVNIRYTDDGGYALQVAAPDNTVFALTVREGT